MDSTKFLKDTLGETNEATEDYQAVFYELIRLELEKRNVKTTPLCLPNIEISLERINMHYDCADFVMPAVLCMLSRYDGSLLLSRETKENLKNAVLKFKYSIEDPNPDSNGVCWFTENHQILYASIEYIAGVLFPRDKFINNNTTGAFHRERGTHRVEQWIKWRARFGFSEWLSSTYYGEDLLALVLVWGLGNDAKLKKLAGNLIELLLFDIAVNSYRGILGASSGRTYVRAIIEPANAATTPIARLLWDLCPDYENICKGKLSLGATALAVFDYKSSNAVAKVALNNDTIINRERMSLDVEDAAKFGVDPEDFENIWFFWGQQTQFHRDVIKNYRKICPSWLNHDAGVTAVIEKYRLAEQRGEKPDPMPERAALPQADIYTYKNAYYSLSCVQDFRKGKAGYQQHTWQASMGGRAVVFTNSPASEDYSSRPNRYAGNKIIPRAAAFKNTVFCIYRLPVESEHFFTTHLYFPQREFDRFEEHEGWIFGGREGAYIALYASIPGKWVKPDIELYREIFHPDHYKDEFEKAKPWEYNVSSHAAVWICEMGDEKTSGSFEDFIKPYNASLFRGDTFSFSFAFNSPSLGNVSFGWDEPLFVENQKIQLRNYRRYDNPWCKAEFGEKNYLINCYGEEIILNF